MPATRTSARMALQIFLILTQCWHRYTTLPTRSIHRLRQRQPITSVREGPSRQAYRRAFELPSGFPGRFGIASSHRAKCGASEATTRKKCLCALQRLVLHSLSAAALPSEANWSRGHFSDPDPVPLEAIRGAGGVSVGAPDLDTWEPDKRSSKLADDYDHGRDLAPARHQIRNPHKVGRKCSFQRDCSPSRRRKCR